MVPLISSKHFQDCMGSLKTNEKNCNEVKCLFWGNMEQYIMEFKRKPSVTIEIGSLETI